MTPESQRQIQVRFAAVEKAGYREAVLLFLEGHRPLWRMTANLLTFFEPFGAMFPGYDGWRDLFFDGQALDRLTREFSTDRARVRQESRR